MVEKITLPNGLRVLMEPLDYIRTACFGVWVDSGSKDETTALNGISHCIEHMLFKGTVNRTAVELAEAMDSIGGQMNAFTTKEFTCFYAHTLSEHVEEGFDILADMLVNSCLNEGELESEKGVIMEEIAMSEDDPEDVVSEQMMAMVWQKSPYGMSILGSRQTVSGFNSDDLRGYMSRYYTPDRMVISICGHFDRTGFLHSVEQWFGALAHGTAAGEVLPPVYYKGSVVTPKKQEQTYLCLAMPGLASGHEQRFAMSVLNIVMGSSSSSRLFQRIREELGLAYSVYSDTAPVKGGGLVCVQASVNPKSAERATLEIIHVLEGLRSGITQKEFYRAKEQLKSGMLMSMENASSRAGYSGRGELLLGSRLTDDQLLQCMEQVTIEQVNMLAEQILDLSQLSVSVTGEIPKNLIKNGFFEKLA